MLAIAKFVPAALLLSDELRADQLALHCTRNVLMSYFILRSIAFTSQTLYAVFHCQAACWLHDITFR